MRSTSSRYDREFVRKWVNWQEYLEADARDSGRPQGPPLRHSFEEFESAMEALYAKYTPEAAETECGVAKETIVEPSRARSAPPGAPSRARLAQRGAGNLGGWQVARAARVPVRARRHRRREGRHEPEHAGQVRARRRSCGRRPQTCGASCLYPKEWPLASPRSSSYLLPHSPRRTGAAPRRYFTRVYNPVWTNPDGMVWDEGPARRIEVIGLHAALTPTWSETAQYAD